jgi:hypothetical protein
MKLAAAISSVLVAALACNTRDGTSSRSTTPVDAAPPEASPPSRYPLGDVSVTTETSGADLDPDGYKIQVDGYWDYSHSVTDIASNGTVVLQGIWAGEHTLTPSDVTSIQSRWRTVDALPIVVHPDSVIAVTFRVTCKAIDRR